MEGGSAAKVKPCPTHQMGVQKQAERRLRDRSFGARLVACGNEQVFGFIYGLTFAAAMEISKVKVKVVFVLRWGVPARHGDIPNAYVKASKE